MRYSIEPGRAVLTARDASAMSGLTRTHIDHLIRQGLLEGVKVGNMWLVYEDSLQAYIASPRKPGPKSKAINSSSTNSMTESSGNQQK